VYPARNVDPASHLAGVRRALERIVNDSVPTSPPATQAPTFETATNARHQARLAGMNPNYWYPAEWSSRVPEGTVHEVKFWGESIAVFRGANGRLGAMENRCAHRQIELTMGHVRDCNLVCLYHGWSYDADARLVGMKHDHFGKRLPQIQLRRYPVQERYGLIWIFPGAPELAERVPLPEIPFFDGPDRWAHITFDYTWEAQHYMVIDNLCNLTHLYVHGNWVPYEDTVLADHGLDHGERIRLHWRHTLRRDYLHPINKLVFAEDLRSNESDTEMIYDYPYQRALSNNRIRSCNFMLPSTPTQTRVFTIQLWKSFGREGSSLRLPASVMQHTWAKLIRPYAKEIFRQDGDTVEAEQRALEQHWTKPYPEPNPSVRLFEKVTIERWRAHLAHSRGAATAEASGAPLDRIKRL